MYQTKIHLDTAAAEMPQLPLSLVSRAHQKSALTQLCHLWQQSIRRPGAHEKRPDPHLSGDLAVELSMTDRTLPSQTSTRYQNLPETGSG